MPFELELPRRLSAAGWKIKIRDKERLEPPHATVIKGLRSWRWNLRTRRFMDARPSGNDVPPMLADCLRRALPRLRREWDRLYPLNPVGEFDD